jgi:adenylosuccinate synthase
MGRQRENTRISRQTREETDLAATVVVGTQWGDEGKGKVVDFLAKDATGVVRFQGGANAGHTIVTDLGEFRLHLVPSGIFRAGVTCLLGTGTVVDVAALLDELDELAARGVPVDGFRLSDRAQVIHPVFMDIEAREEALRGEHEIGTTGRGIGPAYSIKAARFGLQAGDLLDEGRLRESVGLLYRRYAAWLRLAAREAEHQMAEACSRLLTAGERLRPYIVDSVGLTRQWQASDASVLLEGQLGVMRDLDWGTYPYVTSSSPTAGGAATGSGLPPSFINGVVGVVKAYTTAVGAGPVPSEETGEVGESLRQRGGEYGATTGRPRRCGWLDLVAVRYACLLNGVDRLAVTKLDVLDGLPEIKVCVRYRSPRGDFDLVPQARFLEEVKAEYLTVPGWRSSTREIRRLTDLPANARAYLDLISERAGAPVTLASVGPHRQDTVECG